MRTIKIDGTKAGYARLKTLDKIGDYGLELPDAATAPFTVMWDVAKSAPVVCLDRLPIAEVNPALLTMKIHDEYPERFDHALLRAVRNAVSVTDQLAKILKAGDKPKATLLQHDHEDFQVQMSPSDFARAVIGAETIDSRVRLMLSTPTTVGIEIDLGNTSSSAYFTRRGDVMIYDHRGYQQYFFKEAPFKALLEKGQRAWAEKFAPGGIRVALESIPNITEVDAEAINTLHEEQRRADVLISQSPSVEVGPLSMTGWGRDLRYQGLIIARRDNEYRYIVPQGSGLDDQEDRAAMRRACDVMQLMWKAAAMGAKIENFPKVDAEKIAALIEATDFRYDFG